MREREAAALLRGWDDILILNHRRPDGDAVGSAAGLCAALRAMDKRAFVLENPDEGVSFHVWSGPYLAPADFVPAHVVSVDTAERSMLQTNAGDVAVDLAIDHHMSHVPYADNTCVADRSSCGEIILEIVWDLTVPTREIAAPLYVALTTDTGCFRYGNTSAATHRAAAELMRTGIDALSVHRTFFIEKSLCRLRLEALLTQGMEIRGDTVIVSVTRAQLDELGATSDDLDDLANFARQVRDTNVGVTIQELPDGQWKVSLRTAPGIDASAVCALLGGGGHPAAAGCTLPGPVESARARVLEALAAYRKENAC